MDVSDKTAISMPMRNLISILAAVGVGVWAYFGIQERLNNVETRNILMEADLTKNTEFRIGWPRGTMGSLPADSEQFMLIEYMAGQMEKMQVQLDAMMHNAVNIKRLQQDMQEARDNIEKLKDKLREANGG
jgi:succinate dehydrogenase/fumarate reductase flavoprotein subunit